MVERSVYRWEAPDKAVEDIILDPFISPYHPETEPLTAATTVADAPVPSSISTSDNSTIATKSEPAQGFKDRVHALEVALISNALEEHHGHQGQTATALGLSYHQLRGLLRKHDLFAK